MLGSLIEARQVDWKTGTPPRFGEGPGERLTNFRGKAFSRNSRFMRPRVGNP